MTAANDRICEPCPAKHFTTQRNLPFCVLWTCVIVARIFPMKVRLPETLNAPLVGPADLQTMKMPENAQIGGHVQLEHMFLLSVT